MLVSNPSLPSRLWRTTGLAIICIFLFYKYVTWDLQRSDNDFIKTYELQEVEPVDAPHIPKKMWYKIGPKGLNSELQEYIYTCLDQNPTYSYKFMTDSYSDHWVRENFAHDPELVDTFVALPFPILKADFLRYLLLFAEGGIWNDLDVTCNLPIDEWIPEEYKYKARLVVGMEMDSIRWDKAQERQFNIWTFMSQQGSPHLGMVIDDIMFGLKNVSTSNNVTIEGLTLDMLDVIEMTGPMRMTRSILKSLKQRVEGFHEKSYFELKKPLLVDDVLILPSYAMAFNVNIFEEKDVIGPKLVTHHYSGSWRNVKGGEA